MRETVVVSNVIEAVPARVWEVLRDLGALDEWLPLVRECRLEGSGPGAKRFCTLANGVKLAERIEEVDEARKSIRYVVAEGDLPLEDYVGTVAVKALGPDRAEVSWHAHYTPAPGHADELRETFRGAFADGIRGLAAYCAAPPAAKTA